MPGLVDRDLVLFWAKSKIFGIGIGDSHKIPSLKSRKITNQNSSKIPYPEIIGAKYKILIDFQFFASNEKARRLGYQNPGVKWRFKKFRRTNEQFSMV